MKNQKKELKLRRLTISVDSKVLNKKQEIKKAKKLKADVASTLSWMQVKEIGDNFMIVGKGKTEKIVKGFKIIPHNIFLDSKLEQASRIGRLRNLYNNLNFKLYHAFVFNKVNLDMQIAELISNYELEEDPAIQELILDDVQKMIMFIETWKELEFFVMIQGKDDKEFEKEFHDLAWELKQSRMGFMPLNKIDYENYLQYFFENTLINDFIFSRGDFSVLNNKVEVKPNAESI